MNKKLITVFVISFLILTFSVHTILRWQESLVSREFEKEIHIIQADIEERFHLLIESPLAIGVVSAEYFASGQMDEKSYQQLANNILGNFDEMLGLNILNSEGKIVRIFPYRENLPSLGKVSQNYPFFLKSYQNQEPYWLSPPFKLFQGPEGFTFYIPIHRKGEFIGWVAPVISVDKFFKKFIKSEFLASYHLLVQDVETSRPYFQTSALPREDKNNILREHTTIIKGRKIAFISWRKDPQEMTYGWSMSLLIGLILSLTIVYGFNLYKQRRFIKDQLSDVESLLKLTVQNTSSSFNIIQGQLDLMKIGAAPFSLDKIEKNVSYIATLLEQIKVLQNMAEAVDLKKQERTSLLPLFLELSELWNDKLREKRILLDYDPEVLADTRIQGNKWLLCHSVFGSILNHTIQSTPVNGQIKIRCSRKDNQQVISIDNFGMASTQNAWDEGNNSQTFDIVRKVVHLHQGELEIVGTPDLGTKIIVKLSAI